MLYRKIPKNGDELSILGFGCMRLPTTKEGGIDEEAATSQVRGAIDSGINYLDTAWPYHAGQSEAFLSRALADRYRERVKIATKLPSWLIKDRDQMDFYLNEQLKKLNTDRIDYYLLHTLNGASWANLEKLGVKDFLDKAKADGRIINAGFSFHGKQEDFNTIVDVYPWEICQIQYNYLDEENQAGTKGLEYASSKGLGVIIMEPLRGGNIGLPEPPPAVARIWDSAEQKRTPAEWGLRWVWNRPEVTVVLSGMNVASHIEENLAIADQALPNSLSQAELDLVEKAHQAYRKIMKVPCTGCRYCLPCPSDVNIPQCFEIYNQMHMFGNIRTSIFQYAALLKLLASTPGYASQCIQCGECLEKCPQSIEIPDHLENVAKEMEVPDLPKTEEMAKVFLNIK